MDRSRQRNGPTFDKMGGTGAPAMTIASSMQTLEHPAPRPRHRDGPTVSWYGRLLIVSTLLLAAGWEILRLLLTIATLD